MAMTPLLLIGGLALLVMAGRGKKDGEKKNGNGGGASWQLPPGNGNGEKKNGKAPPETILALLADYHLPDGYSLPEDIPSQEWPTTLWLAGDCGAWALGTDYIGEGYDGVVEPDIYEFYHQVVDLTAQSDPELASSPPDHWEQILWNRGEEAFDSPTKRWAIEHLAEMNPACAQLIPSAEDFDSWETYLGAFQTLLQQNPGFYTLYHRLYDAAQELMDVAWAERFPEEATYWHERDWASQALDQDLNLEDKTDWAFHHAYPDGPEVIDPNNPEHQVWVDAWLRLRALIQEMGG